MLRLQVQLLSGYLRARDGARRLASDEAGEITSTVAIIGVLVVGALAAGAIIVARMDAYAKAIPDPNNP